VVSVCSHACFFSSVAGRASIVCSDFIVCIASGGCASGGCAAWRIKTLRTKKGDAQISLSVAYE